MDETRGTQGGKETVYMVLVGETQRKVLVEGYQNGIVSTGKLVASKASCSVQLVS